ncbi:hypothetical protein BD770DRAFT_404777, partial [Pilaira anomala]
DELAPIIKSKKVTFSIKVGCTAFYSKKLYSNGEKHVKRDPSDTNSFASKSRLSTEIKQWIIDAVEKYKDLLPLNETKLSEMENNGDEADKKAVLMQWLQWLKMELGPAPNLENNFLRQQLNNMMYAETEEKFVEAYATFQETHKNEFPVFFEKHLWVKAWRTDASINTNNYIESSHNQLKTYHFGRSRNERVDQVQKQHAENMVTEMDNNDSFQCRSFTNPQIT